MSKEGGDAWALAPTVATLLAHGMRADQTLHLDAAVVTLLLGDLEKG